MAANKAPGGDEMDDLTKLLSQPLLTTPLQRLLELLFGKQHAQTATIQELQSEVATIVRNDAVAKETFERVRLLEQMVRELDACKMTTSQQQELDKRIEAVERLAVHTNNLSTDLLAKQKEGVLPALEFLQKKMQGVYNLSGKLVAVELAAQALGIDIPDFEMSAAVGGGTGVGGGTVAGGGKAAGSVAPGGTAGGSGVAVAAGGVVQAPASEDRPENNLAALKRELEGVRAENGKLRGMIGALAEELAALRGALDLAHDNSSKRMQSLEDHVRWVRGDLRTELGMLGSRLDAQASSYAELQVIKAKLARMEEEAKEAEAARKGRMVRKASPSPIRKGEREPRPITPPSRDQSPPPHDAVAYVSHHAVAAVAAHASHHGAGQVSHHAVAAYDGSGSAARPTSGSSASEHPQQHPQHAEHPQQQHVQQQHVQAAHQEQGGAGASTLSPGSMALRPPLAASRPESAQSLQAHPRVSSAAPADAAMDQSSRPPSRASAGAQSADPRELQRRSSARFSGSGQLSGVRPAASGGGAGVVQNAAGVGSARPAAAAAASTSRAGSPQSSNLGEASLRSLAPVGLGGNAAYDELAAGGATGDADTLADQLGPAGNTKLAVRSSSQHPKWSDGSAVGSRPGSSGPRGPPSARQPLSAGTAERTPINRDMANSVVYSHPPARPPSVGANRQRHAPVFCP